VNCRVVYFLEKTEKALCSHSLNLINPETASNDHHKTRQHASTKEIKI